uniref:Uncharacterized protein n=1 Tax=Chromera velia CCMP2878 TaxID=1169474 RepID=A0A0G4FN16_9ALVE|eukprot:Cvel_3542.t1-p1 / transcript=Cvel_3542.t1 / gene=Cvel_3542 / organism=Chromera_velia_CCMP2878 / gene_product=hypothetical protein / transcript_product=hypothetical protein / location=Cvel_scaffold144:79416-82668(-) / protein_length=797 / sequence_SO=supercontig / SO=protein_coding / is_pseudo=false
MPMPRLILGALLLAVVVGVRVRPRLSRQGAHGWSPRLPSHSPSHKQSILLDLRQNEKENQKAEADPRSPEMIFGPNNRHIFALLAISCAITIGVLIGFCVFKRKPKEFDPHKASEEELTQRMEVLREELLEVEKRIEAEKAKAGETQEVVGGDTEASAIAAEAEGVEKEEGEREGEGEAGGLALEAEGREGEPAEGVGVSPPEAPVPLPPEVEEDPDADAAAAAARETERMAQEKVHEAAMIVAPLLAKRKHLELLLVERGKKLQEATREMLSGEFRQLLVDAQVVAGKRVDGREAKKYVDELLGGGEGIKPGPPPVTLMIAALASPIFLRMTDTTNKIFLVIVICLMLGLATVTWLDWAEPCGRYGWPWALTMTALLFLELVVRLIICAKISGIYGKVAETVKKTEGTLSHRVKSTLEAQGVMGGRTLGGLFRTLYEYDLLMRTGLTTLAWFLTIFIVIVGGWSVPINLSLFVRAQSCKAVHLWGFIEFYAVLFFLSLLPILIAFILTVVNLALSSKGLATALMKGAKRADDAQLGFPLYTILVRAFFLRDASDNAEADLRAAFCEVAVLTEQKEKLQEQIKELDEGLDSANLRVEAAKLQAQHLIDDGNDADLFVERSEAQVAALMTVANPWVETAVAEGQIARQYLEQQAALLQEKAAENAGEMFKYAQEGLNETAKGLNETAVGMISSAAGDAARSNVAAASGYFGSFFGGGGGGGGETGAAAAQSTPGAEGDPGGESQTVDAGGGGDMSLTEKENVRGSARGSTDAAAASSSSQEAPPVPPQEEKEKEGEGG